MNALRCVALVVVATVLLSLKATAKKAHDDFASLSASADVIIIGTVVRLEGDHEAFAVVVVETVLKGTAAAPLRFNAQPSWNCDTTAAQVGERALIFLKQAGAYNGPLYDVVGSGTGIMPIEGRAGVQRLYVEGSSFMPPANVAVDVDVDVDVDKHVRRYGLDAGVAVAVLRRCLAGEHRCGSVRDRTARYVVWGIENDGTSLLPQELHLGDKPQSGFLFEAGPPPPATGSAP